MTQLGDAPSPRRAWIELGLAGGTAAGHFVFDVALGINGPYVVVAVLSWLAYVAWQLRTPGQARAWGIRADTLAPSLVANGAVVVVAGAAMVAFGIRNGRGAPPATFVALLALYPIWGFVQQLIIGPILCKNLVALLGHRGAAVAITAVLFAAVHAPTWRLCALTGLAALVWAPVFLRWPNLWVQAVAHGWLAALAYHFVLAQDAWADFAGTLR